MADYPARKVSLTQHIIAKNGFLEPLCTKCKTRDCENPIEWQLVTVPGGGTKRQRVWKQGQRVSIVVQCEGFCK